MNPNITKNRLLRGQPDLIYQALKYLEKKVEDLGFLSQFIDELELVVKTSSRYNDRAQDLLFVLPGTGWFQSYYEVRDEFYNAVEEAIDEIIVEIKRLQTKHIPDGLNP